MYLYLDVSVNQHNPKKEFAISKRKKNKKHHQMLHNRISPISKFQLQQTFLILWKKFVKNGILSVKNRKVDIIFELFLFELV